MQYKPGLRASLLAQKSRKYKYKTPALDYPPLTRLNSDYASSGHKTLQMMVRYSHQNGEHIRAAMDALEQRYQLTN